MTKRASTKSARELLLKRFVAAASAVPFLLSGTPGWAAGKQQLHDQVPVVVAHLHAVDRLAGSKSLNLAIGLPLRNQEGLATLLQQLYDPASTNFHEWLAAEQFAERFGPSERDYQVLTAFARASGLTVTSTHPNRTLLGVKGSVADIEKAFHVSMQVYPHPTEARTFYAPDVEPSLNVDVPVLAVSGLDNYIIPRPANLKVTPSIQLAGTSPKTGSGPHGNYMGNDFRAAYAPGVTLTGAGQVVGLFQLDGYYPNDIGAYENRAGLPHTPLRNVLLDGATGVPSNTEDVAEVSADIELTIAMAPGLTEVIVYQGIRSSPNNILNRMATDDLAKQLSASWAYAINASTEQIYRQFAAQGQSFFLASGDFGAQTDGRFPGGEDNPYITVVGGTILSTTGPGGSWVSETTWPGSGGGVSANYPIPSWQQGLSMSANQGSIFMRNVPDVAMVAQDLTVIWGNGRTNTFGGTSASAPLWAGFTALVNQQAVTSGNPMVGFINPAMYTVGKSANTSAFHDITTGSNPNERFSGEFFAVAGYDLCTGWGTPAGISLINALAGFPERWVVWVDFARPFQGNGTLETPFNTLAVAINGVVVGGTVKVMGSSSTRETAIITKPLTIEATGGPVTIGH